MHIRVESLIHIYARGTPAERVALRGIGLEIRPGERVGITGPTGSGKSLCYQLPALALPHLTLVISPLLALMHDQLAFLKSKGISAATLDSSQSPEESRRVMQQALDGQLKILMISVERLKNERFRRWSSMRRTVSRSGATTFAPTTSSCRAIAMT